MNKYYKMTSYTNEYSYSNYQIKSKDLLVSYDQMNYQTTNVNSSTLNLPTQNNMKRLKLNHYTNHTNLPVLLDNFLDDYEYWNQSQTTRTNLHCETQANKSSKQLSSPASSTSTSTTRSKNSNNIESEHLSLCESLHKAYQAGHLTKTRYRRLIANERERNRMHGLNIAFENLRSVLPSLGSSKQFSKYETLQMATNYINALREIILNDDLNSKRF